MVGGAVIGIAVTTLVVNEVLTVDSIANSTGPFTGVIDSITTTGVAAMTLLVIGLLVVSASYIMRYMGRF
jgi:predicted DNA repair protein MutK